MSGPARLRASVLKYVKAGSKCVVRDTKVCEHISVIHKVLLQFTEIE